MGAFGNIGVPQPKYSGGIPQYFSSSNPHSFFPGVPQFNETMSRMLGEYGSQDDELAKLMQGYNKYGEGLQRGDLATGTFATTNAQDALAKGFGAGAAQEKGLAGQSLQTGSEIGPMADYAAKMLGTTGINAQAQRKAGDVPGQVAIQKQAVQNMFRQQQMKKLSEMIKLSADAAGANYGYQGAQMAADRGQIALDNAQNQEAQANMQSMMSMLFGQGMQGLGSMGSMFSGSMGPSMDPQGMFDMLNEGGMGSGAGTGAGLMTLGI